MGEGGKKRGFCVSSCSRALLHPWPFWSLYPCFTDVAKTTPMPAQVTRVTGVLWIFGRSLSIEVTFCGFDIRSLGMPRIHLPERGIFLAQHLVASQTKNTLSSMAELDFSASQSTRTSRS